MYINHPCFESIEDNKKIWRFIDLAIFCDILEKNSLFFVTPEKFSDPWEGYLPQKHFDEENYSDIKQEVKTVLLKSTRETIPKIVRQSSAELLKIHFFISNSCLILGTYTNPNCG